ncbi:MAG: leucyl/phenylalanyl-tRNA--protein transferase [Pseudomonadales bacterium]|nr:leucyl/phenylalanyl-tRNA--protein transferase [Pseudomonadales bacterium]MDP6473083.1 leucyl/phenylalanyl-tRNA--protein transferase [Pseudomonadales bacterium]MDP6826160.1 leucyl/phenylalanyl-tRNA--protein transferase [Pseudomonadales bacterium]MDP6971948.1 leucyl/phenylalanyl-tRNA--protein transferase [Pseudomonadales bacterium]
MASTALYGSTPFPDPSRADDDGLLAVGGDLSYERLLDAYAHGIFPWYSSPPILWWSPNPRAVLRPGDVRIPRSLAKRLRNGGFMVTFDRAFAEVIRQCAAPRNDDSGTWITTGMQRAYMELHHQGFAHCVEVWREGELVGGLYGVSLGRMFFGESMFSRERDASKIAFVQLCRQLEAWEFNLIDCQLTNDHLVRLGAWEMPRNRFLEELAANRRLPSRVGSWDSHEGTCDDQGTTCGRVVDAQRDWG